MITKVNARRQAGRPRTYEDAEVFSATAAVLARGGFPGLTLAAVAVELGCTAPALNKRFGSKRDLLFAFLEWSTALARERFRRVRAEHASPLAALRARFAMPVEERRDEVADSVHYANLVTLHLAAAADPMLRPAIERRRRLFEDEIAGLLADAKAAGELVECDPNRLGWVVLAALTGVAQMTAIGAPGAAIEDRLGDMVDEVVAPYRPGTLRHASAPTGSRRTAATSHDGSGERAGDDD